MIDPQTPAPVFENGARVKVRRLQGEFTVLSSRMIGKVRRYRLDAVPDTGALLAGTEAFGDDMERLPDPVATPELALMPEPVPHPTDAIRPAQEPADASPDAAAPAGERSAADAIRSPGAGITLNAEPGIWGGLDEVVTQDPDGPGEEDGSWAEGWEMRRSSVKELRYYPAVAMSYGQLKNIIYSSHFKGMEKGPYAELDNDTPVGVAVTRETNGAAVWIITTRDRGEVREARLELFYPADRVQNPSCETMATEHGVLLALRKIPIRTNDLEVLLLQIEP